MVGRPPLLHSRPVLAGISINRWTDGSARSRRSPAGAVGYRRMRGHKTLSTMRFIVVLSVRSTNLSISAVISRKRKSRGPWCCIGHHGIGGVGQSGGCHRTVRRGGRHVLCRRSTVHRLRAATGLSGRHYRTIRWRTGQSGRGAGQSGGHGRPPQYGFWGIRLSREEVHRHPKLRLGLGLPRFSRCSGWRGRGGGRVKRRKNRVYRFPDHGGYLCDETLSESI